jgi:hypothetical protein
LSACPNVEIAPENGCIYGTNNNICNQGLMCIAGVCLSPCPNDEIAPENGWIYDSSNYICNQGQMWNAGVCQSPQALALVVFLIVGLYIESAIMIIFF